MTENTETDKESALRKVFLLFLFSIPMSAFAAHIFKCLYQWFMIPVFHTPYISTVQFMGLGCVKTFLIMKLPKEDEHKNKTMLQLCLNGVLMYLYMWGLGAVIHFWLV